MKSAGSAASARTKRKKLKIRGIEGLREEIFQAIGFGFAGQVDQHQLHVAAKLPENLPAGAAGRCEIFGIGGHGHAAEVADAFRDCLEHGHAFGAEGEAVGGILHVAPGMNAAVVVFDGRAYQELGEWREGIQAGGKGGGDQRVGHKVYPKRDRPGGLSYSSSLGSKAFKNFTRVSRTMAPVSSTSS